MFYINFTRVWANLFFSNVNINIAKGSKKVKPFNLEKNFFPGINRKKKENINAIENFFKKQLIK